jgi:predicted RNA-binding Zn ribbon-like protein
MVSTWSRLARKDVAVRPGAISVTLMPSGASSPNRASVRPSTANLVAAIELALSGQWARIKACRNEPCHFGFFDRSKNTSGGYCSTQCSSRASMRAYRARKNETLAKSSASSPTTEQDATGTGS